MSSDPLRQRNLESIQVFERALAAEFGVEVPVVNTELRNLRQHLYNVRKSDPRYACLSILTSPRDPEKVLWIVKRTTLEVDDAET